MNRNGSYVALTRHRQGLQVYTDRQTFADRDHLDRSLSRAPYKDLARDYAAAAIERRAVRLAPLADQAEGLRGELREIRRDLALIEQAATAVGEIGKRSASLEKAVTRVYADPAPPRASFSQHGNPLDFSAGTVP